jgi:uncharacterized protein YuzB (UPF0349 family)
MFSIFSPFSLVERRIKQVKHLADVIQGKDELSIKGVLGFDKVKKTRTGNLLTDSLIDNVFKDVVKPEPGCVVHCGLFAHQLEHSGIYVGDNKIIHLDGSGLIEEVTPEQFLRRLNGLDSSMSIYVSCNGTDVTKSEIVADRALAKVGQKTNYSVLENNCHQFSSGCLTGNFNNSDRYFSDLENTAINILGLNEWRVWKL